MPRLLPRLRHVVVVCATTAVLGLFSGLSAAAAQSAPLPADFFGVNAWTLFNAPQADWSVQLTAMEQSGVRLVRSDANWGMGEWQAPRNGVHSYDWTHFDPIVTALAEHDLVWFPIIDYSAPWASALPGNAFAPPADDANYAAYAAALAKRYGASGDFWRAHPELPYRPVEQWEIWNEENGRYFWQTGPDPARYIDLYLAARSAIRSVDPNAKAVIGGLGDGISPNGYIGAMYQHRPDAHGQVDAIAYHPYPLDGNLSAGNSMQLVRSLRSYLSSIGEQALPIEITEVGWTTQGTGALIDRARAARLTELIQDLAQSSQGVTEFMPYVWVNGQPSDGFGMFNSDGSPTLEGSAYAAAIRTATAPATTPASSTSSSLGAPSPGAGQQLKHWGLQLLPRGRISVKVACSQLACKGDISATVRPKHASRQTFLRRAHRLPHVRFSIQSGRVATLSLRLPPRLRQLAHRTHFSVVVQIVYSDASSAAQRVSRFVAVI